MDKYFICLANSYKRGGRCIAGVEIVFDNNDRWKLVRDDDGRPRWIRPIARTIYGEIPNFLGENIKVFSIVRLTNVVPCPEKAHTENVYYSHIEQYNYAISQDSNLINLLIDTKHQSLFHNRGRAVSTKMIAGINYSLMLIHPDKASAYIDENREKSKNRMRFTYYGTEYDFPITDPTFIDCLKKSADKYTNINDVYLTLSLGLEFEGWHHKLVAGVIIPTDSTKLHEVGGVSYMAQQKQIHHNAYAKWTTGDEEQLSELVKKGVSVQELCQIFGRNEGAIRSRISKLGLDVSVITEKNEEYHGGLCIMPSYLSKGLEFDAVILYNANNVNYTDSNIDSKLLYVAITRAMHELYINYSGELPISLRTLTKDNKVLKRKK